MNKIIKNVIILFLSISIIAIAVFCVKTTKQRQIVKIEKLESIINDLKSETISLKFKILERKDEKVKFSFKTYNYKGEKKIEKTMELNGSELFFDFWIVKLDNEKYISVPKSVFTDKIAPDKAVSIYEDVHEYKSEYGSAVHDLSGLKNYNVGMVYKVVCHTPTGAIEVLGE